MSVIKYSICVSDLFRLGQYSPNPCMLLQTAGLRSFLQRSRASAGSRCVHAPVRSTHSPIDGPLYYFCILTIVTDSALNIGVQVFF